MLSVVTQGLAGKTGEREYSQISNNVEIVEIYLIYSR